MTRSGDQQVRKGEIPRTSTTFPFSDIFVISLLRPGSMQAAENSRIETENSEKSLQSGLRPAKNQRVNIMCSFVGIHRFEIHDMPDHVILV